MDCRQSIDPSSEILLCWGRAASGELGIQGESDKNVKEPSLLPGFERERVKQIACGKQHTMFLLQSGLVYSCGSNESKQLGRNIKDASKDGSKPGIN